MKKSQALRVLRKIKCLAMDVDGVLTDGRTYLAAENDWRRTFHIRDGLGIILLHEKGYKTAFITLSRAHDIRMRAENLKINHFFEKSTDKGASFEMLLEQTGLRAEEVAFIGDDVIDLPVFAKCGLSCAPCDAHPKVLAAADMIMSVGGGRGAVRELCDLILEHGAYASRLTRALVQKASRATRGKP